MEKKENVNIKHNLKVYFGFVKRYKLLFFAVLLFGLILESTNTVTKFLFKTIVDNGSLFSEGVLSSDDLLNVLVFVGFSFIVLISIKSVVKWIHIHTINHLDSNLMLDVKRKFFNHLIGLSHSFHTTHKTGSLISRLNRGGGAIERMTDLIVFNVSPLIFQLVIVSLSLAYFSGITSIVILITVITFIGFSFIFEQIQQKYNLDYNRREDIEKANIADVFTNIDSIKYFGKEKLIGENFAKLSANTKSAALKNWGYFRWIDAGQNFILGLGTFFLIFFPLRQFLSGEITLGTLVFIYTVYGDLLGPMYGFVHGMRNFYRAMADFNDLFEYSKIENDIIDIENAKNLNIYDGKVDFKNISFSYNKKKVISDLSLEINPGEKVALVGHSGCGKTTLIKLLYRFYNLNSGNILIDGKDIKDFNQESLRSELSIVPQEAILFDDTIYNNILFSNPSASRKEVIQAIKSAQLDKFISGLPNKEKTIVGERGVRLSGGEKQRVSIARAILANKKILILDEATSALDSRTENEIQKDLENLMKNRTSIIIAHRLSTIMKADKIVVMEKGSIVQIGKHQDLIRKKGVYRDLWNLQKGGYIKE